MSAADGTFAASPRRGQHPIEVRPADAGDPLGVASLARELADKYLIWDAFVAGQRRVDVHPLVLSRALHDAAVRAAEGVVRVIGRIAERAHDDETERAHYALPHDAVRLAAASRDGGDRASLMRVDLLLDETGAWRACEINADCPGGHNEALGLPRLARAAGFMAGANPTHVVERLVERLRELAQGGAVGLVYATAYAEDLQVCALLKRELERRGVQAVLAAPTQPRLRRGEVLVGRTPVRVLYRYFPTEWMDGQKNLGGLVDALASGRLKTLTAFSHLYTQSKLAFARAWAHGATLDDEDRAILDAHVPYSVDLSAIDRAEVVGDRARWVVKRAMGRVGDQVFVGPTYAQDDWTPTVDAIRALRADGQAWLAQRFVKQRPIPTPWGNRFVTLGAYVEGGRFAGYFARITRDSHVSHDALCVPVFHETTGRESEAA